MGVSDLLRYIGETLTVSDFVLFGGITLLITLIGMLTPKLNKGFCFFIYRYILSAFSVEKTISFQSIRKESYQSKMLPHPKSLRADRKRRRVQLR